MQINTHENNRRIIVVEDDEGLNSLISKKLERFGYKVESYTKGCKAVEAFNTKDLLLLDYKLQDCYAEEIIQKLQNKNTKPKFIIMTGQGDEKTAVKMMKMGAKDYITKDTNFIENLPSAINKVLNLIDVEEKLENSQKELQKSEEKYRLIVETASEVIYTISPEGTVTSMNKVFEDITDWKCDEVIGRSFLEFIHPDDKELAIKIHQQIQENIKPSAPFELRFLLKSGQYIDVEFSITPIIENNKPIATLGIARDITQRKKAEKALVESQRMMSTLLSNLPGMAYRSIRDENLTLKFVSDGSRQVTGYSPSDLINNFKISYIELVHPEDKLVLWESIQNAIENRESFQVVYRIVDSENHTKWVWEKGRAVGRTQKNIPIIEGFITDISTLKKTEQQLKESEERYRLITENVNDLITKLDLSFHCTYVSPIAEKLTGYKSNELLGKSVFNFVHPNEKVSLENYFARILRGSDNTIIRYRFRKKNGEYIWLETNNHVLKTDKLKNKEIISVSRDITEVLKSEELIKAKEAAEYASKTKSEFLANLSHEIRNPMNVIIGMTNTLSRTQINQEQTKYIEALRISSNNLMNIINDILDISKIEANKVDIYNIHFKLDELFNELKMLYQHQADFKGLDFQCKIAPNVPLNLVGDYNKLKQILVNLISNAIKFTKKGSVSLLAELVLIEKKSVKIKFIVHDTGLGIKKENFNKIFEAFTQLDSSSSKQYSGTGLGLAIVKKFTDLLSGNITFDSKYNKGTTFYVQIPFHLYDKSVTKKEKQQKLNKKQPIKEMKILLAEDDAINQMYLKNFLENQGWQVETAKNGQQVVDKFDKETYDLILMDGQMPKMDGFEATRIIRSKEQENQLKHVPIIAITGYAVSEEKDKFLNAGMDEFITKPINEQKLLNIIEALTTNT